MSAGEEHRDIQIIYDLAGDVITALAPLAPEPAATARAALDAAYEAFIIAAAEHISDSSCVEYRRAVGTVGGADRPARIVAAAIDARYPGLSNAMSHARGREARAALRRTLPGRHPERETPLLNAIVRFYGHDSAARSIAGGDPMVCVDCEAPYNAAPELGLMVCSACGHTYYSNDGTNPDAGRAAGDGKRGKSGGNGAMRQFQKHLVHIQAMEPEQEIADADGRFVVVERVEAERRRRRLPHSQLTIDHVRDILRDLDLTAYNINAPMIYKKLTGRGPPPLGDEISQQCTRIFRLVVAEEKTLNGDRKANRNSYPYYIFKILEHLLPPQSRRILFYIHLQEQETLDKNDETWFDICRKLGLPRIPTSRARAYR